MLQASLFSHVLLVMEKHSDVCAAVCFLHICLQKGHTLISIRFLCSSAVEVIKLWFDSFGKGHTEFHQQ